MSPDSYVVHRRKANGCKAKTLVVSFVVDIGGSPTSQKSLHPHVLVQSSPIS